MYKTKQEEMWEGQFGNDYTDRNKSVGGSNVVLFSEILSKTENVNTVIEFGANIGLNLEAIKTLLPHIKCSAVEINKKAADILKHNPFFDHEIDVFNQSILEYDVNVLFDFVFTKGVLIHINPKELQNVYQKMYDSSKRYICIAEYYNPMPITIEYRGNDNLLYKRDFAGEFMDIYPDLRLVDYGFKYHNDNNFPQDDLTWFLLEKGLQ